MAENRKLPNSLKDWKITECLNENEDFQLYKAYKKDSNGKYINAVIKRISISGESYTDDEVKFLKGEADFLNSVSKSCNNLNYLDVALLNDEDKKTAELYIVKEDLKTLGQYINEKDFSESEITEFGIKLSEILEQLESKNIYHGNLNPDNIYVAGNGEYKIAGFSDLEGAIEDKSFVAPEIGKGTSPDFTTDIYSLGLILFYLCNEKTLPFESNETDKETAVKLRLEGKTVNAPKNGNEKLKSVIVIACQPNNSNRWKNAGNIKNALTSIKSELPAEKPSEKVIIPETTDFGGNVFEEFDYEEFAEEPAAENENPAEDTEDLPEQAEDVTVKEQEKLSSETNAEAVDNFDVNAVNADVFDNFDVEQKSVSKPETVEKDDPKDYGDFFDYDSKKADDQSLNISQSSKTDISDVNIFDTNDDDFSDKPEKKTSKKNVAVIVVCILITLAALGFIAFCIFSGFGKSDNNKPTNPVETTIDEATTAPVTEAPTTAEPTTVEPKENVIAVVGYGYSYGKELLEAQGFTVEVGEYHYSDEYPEGYIIKQTPNGDSQAEKGSTVTLDISLGPEQVQTEPPTEPSTEAPTKAPEPSNQSDGSYIFSNSNSSYLSQGDVSALSDSDLNIALNEIYARRGRIFTTPSLSEYFNSKSWYTPLYTAADFEKNVTFNAYEQANLQLMINEQVSRGYR